jgi:hypothetical protein
VAAECPVPPYLKDTIELLKPRGDLATETADAMVAIRNRRRRIARLVASGPAIATMALATAFFWHTRLAAQARLDAVTDGLLAAAKNAHVYMDTCVIPLDRFSDYVHHPTLPAHACDVKPVIESLRLPALVVAQTGNGKRGFLQSLRATLALRGRPSVLVTYRDCVRGGPKDVEVNLAKCLTAGVAADTHASVDDAEKWLADPKRYVLIFDAVDDSASREKIFRLVQALWQHQQEGGPVVLSSQPENLKYVMAKYGLEDWMVWLNDQLPTIDVRGIDPDSAESIGEYAEHKVPLDEIRSVRDFPQKCEDARPLIKEWISQPKLFREQGKFTVAPVVAAMRALGPDCSAWRHTVLTPMLRARIWSYCHDELCDYQLDGERFIAAAQKLRGEGPLSDTRLTAIATELGFKSAEEIAFPLLSTGVLIL